MVAEEEERDLMEALFTQGPISVCIDGSHLHNYGSGIITDGCEPGYVDHAVLLVGYGSENDQDFWLLKNSWGTDWGEKGYYKLARNRNNLCSLASYGIFPVE